MQKKILLYVLIHVFFTAKAIYDNKLLECYFTRSFYKHILGILVKHTDMESEDYSFYKGLVYLTEHNISDLGYELTFSTEARNNYFSIILYFSYIFIFQLNIYVVSR